MRSGILRCGTVSTRGGAGSYASGDGRHGTALGDGIGVGGARGVTGAEGGGVLALILVGAILRTTGVSRRRSAIVALAVGTVVAVPVVLVACDVLLEFGVVMHLEIR